MKKIMLLAFMLNSCILGFCAERIVAVVNREIITQSEVNNFSRFLKMQLAAKYSGEELEERYKQILPDVLNRLIEDKLIVQEAKKEKITVDENRLKARIAQMKSAYPSEKEFVDELIRNGLTVADVEAKLKDQLLMFEMVNKKVRSKIRVSPLEVTEFYQEHKEEFSEPAKRNVVALVGDSKEKMEQALVSLRNGADFRATADSLGLQLRELGEIVPGQLIKELDQVISLLQVGEFSDIVKFQNKFFIFKLVDISSPKELSLEEAKQQIYDYLAEEKMQEKVNAWLEELKEKSYIDIKQERE